MIFKNIIKWKKLKLKIFLFKKIIKIYNMIKILLKLNLQETIKNINLFQIIDLKQLGIINLFKPKLNWLFCVKKKVLRIIVIVPFLNCQFKCFLPMNTLSMVLVSMMFKHIFEKHPAILEKEKSITLEG